MMVTIWSIVFPKIIPILIKIKIKIIVGTKEKVSCNRLKDSGIKSNNETEVITPAAKDKDGRIIFLLSKGRKIGRIPNKVAKPAIVERKNAICTCNHLLIL